MPSGKRLIGLPFIVLQDNDPKHTANSVKKYLQNKSNQGHIEAFEFPAQSPDLNPIENLWKILKDQMKNVKTANLDDLFHKLTEIWNGIDVSYLYTLVESMPRRCKAVIAAKGMFTKY